MTPSRYQKAADGSPEKTGSHIRAVVELIGKRSSEATFLGRVPPGVSRAVAENAFPLRKEQRIPDGDRPAPVYCFPVSNPKVTRQKEEEEGLY